jgi:hypothetical protein
MPQDQWIQGPDPAVDTARVSFAGGPKIADIPARRAGPAGEFGLQPAYFVNAQRAAAGSAFHSANTVGDISGAGILMEGVTSGDDGQGPSQDARFGAPPDSPVPLRKGMKVTPKLARWLKQGTTADRYSLNVAPDFISQFRARYPEFVRLENQNFELSKVKSPSGERLERTLLVYESTTEPKKYKIVPIIGKADITEFYYLGTKIKLPFGQLPELNSFKLIIAEHAHPT